MIYWIITDTHLNHNNIIRFCNRPENHEELILKNLSVIKEDDVLIHLGDICIRKDYEMNRILLDSIKCRNKWLIKGNHDKKNYGWYLDMGWNFIGDEVRLNLFGKKIVLSHKPIPYSDDYCVNLHGHLHNNHTKEELSLLLHEKNRLISIENNNYKPVDMSKAIL
jgi:calcineurin-like phosphoesterase family protein